MATPVDALFFLIPMLEKAGDKFCDLEHILTCGDSQHAALLTPLVTKQLQNICDVKEAGGQSYYRLSHEKASFVFFSINNNFNAVISRQSTSLSLFF